MFNGYRYEVDKNAVVILGNDEAQVLALKAMLEKQQGFTCTLENSDPFGDLKDSIEKAKQQKKERANFEAYQQSGMWVAPNMCTAPVYSDTFNPYAGKFERPRGAGFTRRAVESSDEEDNHRKEKKEA